MNLNMGRFYARLAFEEWEGYEDGKGHAFLFKVTEERTNCELYVFEPAFQGEKWALLILKYGDSHGVSDELHTQAQLLANRLDADITELFGE